MGATLALRWYDDIRSFTIWWWGSSTLILVVLVMAILNESQTEPRDFLLNVSWWTTATALLIALPPILGFLRQGRVSRHAPKLLGIFGPFLMLRVVASVAPGSAAIAYQAWTLVAVGSAGIVVVVMGSQLGTRALRRVLRDTKSLAGWGGPQPLTYYVREGSLLTNASKMLGLDWLTGTVRAGKIDGRAAVIISGKCSATAVPHIVDRRSRIALLTDRTLSRRGRNEPEDLAEITTLFMTLVAVQIGTQQRFTSFDLRSRAHRDDDLVFHNDADRIERFESIELDRHHNVRIPATSSQIAAWTSFAPVVIDELARRRRLSIRKQGPRLVSYRIGGCGRPDELDELVEITEWFTNHITQTIR